jgi:hypothetical protein
MDELRAKREIEFSRNSREVAKWEIARFRYLLLERAGLIFSQPRPELFRSLLALLSIHFCKYISCLNCA